MQAKVFLSTMLASLLAAGVIATPTALEVRDIKSTHGWDGTVTALEKVAASVGNVKPHPKGTVITPKENDTPVASTDVEARDLENLSKRTAGCIYVTKDSITPATSAVEVCTSVLQQTAAAPTGTTIGDTALALSAPTQVLPTYPRIALMSSADILSYKAPLAKSSPTRTVLAVDPCPSDTPGTETSEDGTTTWAPSAAGGSGWMQLFSIG
ncbi:unnamed protein product [Tuber aestivum]|uniref:Uncharacterized protein n=1 Tax=Tuber aestivum TaxID=59557 RepID=A0A292PWK6_9PEZI|nr:unnamed protein product [Tuber aestivum]